MNVEIAQRLADLRREKGYSQEELAENLGLSRQAVSKWERAESSPDTGNIVALAKLYGVTLDELLRVDADIEDDVKFEAQDRASSIEATMQSAVEEAHFAAAQAQVAAAQATTVHAQVQQAAQAVAEQPQEPQQYAAPVGSPVPASPHAPVPEGLTAEEQRLFNDTQEQEKKKGPWMSFPYPILCTILFLCIGFFGGSWHPGWVIFLTIPLYYWIANIIENDPNYRK